MPKDKLEVKVEIVPIDQLTQDDQNANEGTDRSKPLIDESIDRFGFLETGTIDINRKMVGGNKRFASAKSHGYENVALIELPPNTAAVIKRDDLDLDSPDAEVREKSRQAAYWLNWSAVQSIKLNAVQVEDDIRSGIDLSGLMTKKDLTRIGVQLDRPDPETASNNGVSKSEEAQATWNVSPGDVYQLGRHILACGDSTDLELLARLLPAAPSFTVTSPPYGVGKDYEEGGIEEWRNLINSSLETWSTIGASLIAINLGDKHTGNDGWEAHTFGELITMAASFGYQHLNTRVWVKQPAWSQTPYWHNSFKTVDEFEFIAVFATVKPSYKPRLTDDENNEWGFRSVWNINSIVANDVHTAMFPIELPMRLIRLHTDQDDLIFEPFAGSGTTIIACEAMRRSCIAVELQPEYCAVALQRYADVTGTTPTLLDAGENDQ